MLVVGENLKLLVEQFRIVDRISSFDHTSLTLHLSRSLITIAPPENAEVTYGHSIPDSWIKRIQMPEDGFTLSPKAAVLGCSVEEIRMPLGYFGFLQTKGSLARLFVQIHCSDSQVDSGFRGKVTFEIVNLSNFRVRLLPHQPVAQLFIFKTSTNVVQPYEGRYQGAEGPTIQKPKY